MNTSVLKKLQTESTTPEWVDIARTLGQAFAKRAAGYDQNSEFAADNYRDLREYRLFSAGIPSELGGGGATYEELSAFIRELGRHCGSTALAFAMHTHPIAVNVYKHLRGDEVATKTLRKIADNELIIAGTGANDWLESSGEAERVEGGYRVSAHKRFVSGAPGAQVFVTSVSHAGPEGTEVLHFAIPFSSEGVRLVETWKALGMRGTGSHDVVLENVFVPEASIVARRPAGVWHPMWNVVLPTALPLITSVYVGLAEAAADLAISAAKHRQAELAPVVGEMLNSLTAAQLTLTDMVRLNDHHGFTPTLELANAILTRKTIAAEAIKKSVELAAELVGGPGFFQGHPMERIVRDVRAMHFHPLPARRQRIFSGRVALGYDPVVGD
jgi:acyl-CoA dehydrogenase